MDYGYQIKQLVFKQNGEILFCPRAEVVNKRYAVGEFRTFTDTLVIYFKTADYPETYSFEISGDDLFLTPIENMKNETYSIVDNSTRDWKKENE